MSKIAQYWIATHKLAKVCVLASLRVYKWALSPLFLPACRYVPTCSDYTTEAVECYGVFRGCRMAMGRVLRCHPLAKGGYDPVVRSRDYVVVHGAIPPAAVTE
jgi:uncharacterized protein